MAHELNADSLLYLPLEAVARCIGLDAERLCRACITGDYPTAAGERLYKLALLDRANEVGNDCRTYEKASGNGNGQSMKHSGPTRVS